MGSVPGAVTSAREQARPCAPRAIPPWHVARSSVPPARLRCLRAPPGGHSLPWPARVRAPARTTPRRFHTVRLTARQTSNEGRGRCGAMRARGRRLSKKGETFASAAVARRAPAAVLGARLATKRQDKTHTLPWAATRTQAPRHAQCTRRESKQRVRLAARLQGTPPARALAGCGNAATRTGFFGAGAYWMGSPMPPAAGAELCSAHAPGRAATCASRRPAEASSAIAVRRSAQASESTKGGDDGPLCRSPSTWLPPGGHRAPRDGSGRAAAQTDNHAEMAPQAMWERQRQRS